MANTAIFWGINSILVGIVGANAQGTTEPLLATHALNIWSFLAAKLLYCLALEADEVIRTRARQLNQENCTHFWSFVAFVSGSVSSVSLVSTLVSRSAGYIILSIAWICAAITIVVYQYGSLVVDGCRWLFYELLKPFLNNIWNLIKGNNNSSSNNNNMLTETQQQRATVQVEIGREMISAVEV
ncbi:hypothetical protein OWV82_012257 [Melia azedarach]|uniref:Uncharacterized protein n=1 Tax=Melia azedarach TaxID=155640 RepID=A0ACC1Y1R1_MELAZ|nr:hypothetical protein OWV82_012257 [Melia azedarach]